MSFVKLSPEAIQAIKSYLETKGVNGPVRIDLHSTGCCDPSLGLCMDGSRPSDIAQEVNGVTLVISPETYQSVGEVTISRVDEADRKGYVLTSSKPLSEWEGFGVCDIRSGEK
jgi:Fe-S cluster assembly iron-binding protein IscA